MEDNKRQNPKFKKKTNSDFKRNFKKNKKARLKMQQQRLDQQNRQLAVITNDQPAAETPSRYSALGDKAKQKFQSSSKKQRLIFALSSLLVIGLILFGGWLLIEKLASNKVYTEGYYFSEINVDLDPLHTSQDGSNQVLSNLLYARIIMVGADRTVQPGLTDLSVDESGKIYTITIKKDSKWSDSQPVNSDDILFTLNNYKLTNKDALAKTLNAATIEKTDNLNLKITLAEPNSDFKLKLAEVPIAPKHNYDDQKNQIDDQVFSGAYIYDGLQVLKNGLQFKLKANTSFYNYSKVTNKVINIRMLDNKDQLIKDYKSGAVTASFRISPQDVNSSNIYSYKTTAQVFAFFNTTNISDPGLRSALSLAINSDGIASGLNLAKSQSVLNPNEWGYDKAAKQSGYDQAKAKELFEAAGYIINQDGKLINKTTNQQLSLSLVTVEGGEYQMAADMLRQQLSEVGVKLNASVVSGDELRTEYFKSHAYDILIYGIDMGYKPDIQTYWSSNQTSTDLNLSNISDRKIEGAVAGYVKASDNTQKEQSLTKFTELWSEQHVAKALYVQELILVSDRVIKTPQEGLVNNSADYINKIPYFSF